MARVDRSRPLRRIVAILVALQVVLFAVDLAIDEVLALAHVVPVFLVALLVGPRTTAAFGVAALLLVFVSGLSADEFFSDSHLARIGIAVVSVAAATVGAAGRARLERDVRQLELLAAIGPESVGGRSPRETAEALLGSLVPVFADGAAIDVRGEDGTLTRLAARGTPPPLPRPDADEGSDPAILTLPLRVPGHPPGRLTAIRRLPRRRFGRGDARFALAVAARIALALENARLVSELTRAESAQRAVSEALQRSLQPPDLPSIPGVRLASHYAAVGEATQVGGDFYDAFAVGDGVLLVIGDVTGKGAEAASVTAFARGALEAAATQTASATAAVARLDALLARRDELSLCSVACVHLVPRDGVTKASVVLAGHPPVLLLRGGRVTPLGEPGPLPGAFAGARWTATAVDLEPGDVLVLRTDGVTDTVGADGRLGESRLRDALTGFAPADAGTVVGAVRRLVAQHTQGAQRDDTAVLVAEITGPGVVVPPEGRDGPPVDVVIELEGEPRSIAEARRAVDDHLAGHLAAREVEDLRLLVSELATNAVRHGGEGPYRLQISCDPTRVAIAVTDPGEGFAPPGRATRGEQLASGGYGLELVAELSDRWGIDRRDGTRVWCERDRS